MPGTAPPQNISSASALTLCACLLLAPLVAFALRALWEDPELPILARLLWARAKELVGVRVSAKKLERELVGVARRYAQAAPAAAAAAAAQEGARQQQQRGVAAGKRD